MLYPYVELCVTSLAQDKLKNLSLIELGGRLQLRLAATIFEPAPINYYSWLK